MGTARGWKTRMRSFQVVSASRRRRPRRPERSRVDRVKQPFADMSRTCRGRVAGVARACRGRVAGVSWACRGRVVGVSRACRGRDARGRVERLQSRRAAGPLGLSGTQCAAVSWQETSRNVPFCDDGRVVDLLRLAARRRCEHRDGHLPVLRPKGRVGSSGVA